MRLAAEASLTRARMSYVFTDLPWCLAHSDLQSNSMESVNPVCMCYVLLVGTSELFA